MAETKYKISETAEKKYKIPDKKAYKMLKRQSKAKKALLTVLVAFIGVLAGVTFAMKIMGNDWKEALTTGYSIAAILWLPAMGYMIGQIIGAVIGGAILVGIVFLLKYWKSEAVSANIITKTMNVNIIMTIMLAVISLLLLWYILRVKDKRARMTPEVQQAYREGVPFEEMEEPSGLSPEIAVEQQEQEKEPLPESHAEDEQEKGAEQEKET